MIALWIAVVVVLLLTLYAWWGLYRVTRWLARHLEAERMRHGGAGITEPPPPKFP